MFVWGWLFTYILASWAIGGATYYEEDKWGLCTFCYETSSCKSAYDAYMLELDAESVADGRPLNPATKPTYSDYFHRNIRSSVCQGLNTMWFMAVFAYYFFI